MSNLCPSCDEYAMPREWELDKEEIELLRQQAAADKAEIEALRKDAERYKLLRDRRWVAVAAFDDGEYYAPPGMTLCRGKQLDEFADAAIADK